MLAGALTATLSGTASYLPKFENTLSTEYSAIFSSVAIFVFAALGVFARQYSSSLGDARLWNIMFEAVGGLSFAFAMAISNMTKLSATISFLNVTNFNPALMFVMCGAISVTSVGYFIVLKQDKPLVNEKWSLPKLSDVDLKLVAGAALFGCGWGLVGACPGPALVNVGYGRPPQLIYATFMTVGVLLHQLLDGIEFTFHTVKVSEAKEQMKLEQEEGGVSLGIQAEA